MLTVIWAEIMGRESRRGRMVFLKIAPVMVRLADVPAMTKKGM
jgi:hypothetical protein